jgi:response regulator of citrate/malate metabolism
MNIQYYIIDSNNELLTLKNMLANFFSFFKCLYVFSGKLDDDTLHQIVATNPNVVFIDDAFLNSYGFNIIETLSQNNISVVVATSNTKTTTILFKYNILFCIKKPLTVENLSLAVNKVLTIMIKKDIVKK